MFSQKKRRQNNWVIYFLIAVSIALIMILIFFPEDNATENGNAINDQGTDYSQKMGDEDSYLGQYADENENIEDVTGDKIEKQESYYLVKNDNNEIKVYFCDQEGELTELETTAIIYETLSETDQQMFDDGVKISGRDELFKLLQDFES